MDFLDLVHEVGKIAKPFHKDHLVKPEWDTSLEQSGFDSLDMLMMGIYIGDIYGVPEEIGKTMPFPKTCVEFKAFIDQHKTIEPESLQAALEKIK